MLKKTDFTPLNVSEMGSIRGAYKKGDLVDKIGPVKIVYCVTKEVSCESGFTWDRDSHSGGCERNFTIK